MSEAGVIPNVAEPVGEGISVVVQDGAFTSAPLGTVPVEEGVARGAHAVEIGPDVDLAELGLDARETLDGIEAIAVLFPSFADGRGLTLGHRLRRLGFAGHLRARGHLVPDQYPMALRCGFDAVELPVELARRMPEEQWREAMGRVGGSYLERLQKGEAA